MDIGRVINLGTEGESRAGCALRAPAARPGSSRVGALLLAGLLYVLMPRRAFGGIEVDRKYAVGLFGGGRAYLPRRRPAHTQHADEVLPRIWRHARLAAAFKDALGVQRQTAVEVHVPT